MKITSSQDDVKTFKPCSVTIKFESQLELDRFFTLCNTNLVNMMVLPGMFSALKSLGANTTACESEEGCKFIEKVTYTDLIDRTSAMRKLTLPK